MQTELTNAKKCKTENKICKPKYKDDMQDKTKQNKMI